MAAVLTTLFLGAVVGSIYSMSAFGLVLSYRASGVFNFAHGALGMFFGFVFFQLVQGGEIDLVAFSYTQPWTLPTPVALTVVVGVLAPAFGWALDVVLFRRLRDAGEVVKVVTTIGLLVALQGLAGVMWGATTTLTPVSIFSTGIFVLGDFRASAEQVAAISLSVALAVGLLLLLRSSSLGVRMRAVVDDPDVAELAGVDAVRVSSTSWAISTAFAALAGILIVPFYGSLDPVTLSFLVVAATAAAVAGRLESFPLTLLGGFGIGIAQVVVQRFTPADIARQLRPAIPFLVLFVLLFLPRWKRRPSDRFEPPPLPPVVRTFSRTETMLRAGVGLVVGVGVIFLLEPSWQLHFARVPAIAVIFLSLVLVTGYGGQVSLSQAALAGVGAFVTAHLVSGFGVPFFAAVILGGLAVVPVGVFLALRAASLSPLFLGFATLAFGAVMDEVAFTSRTLSGGLSGIFFDVPGFLTSPRAYYLMALGVFVALAIAVTNLRRSQTGLALAAMRDTEVGLGAQGIDVARLKLTVFSMSAFVAGIGGALLSGADGVATPFSYFKFQSLLFLTLAVIGGIGSWSGALAGAIVFQLAAPFVHEPFISDNPIARTVFGGQLEALLPVFFGLGAIGLARNPHGLVEQIRGLVRPEPVADETAAVVVREARSSGGPVTFEGATLYHRPDCVLAAGKEPLDVSDVAALEPCGLCQARMHESA